MVYACLLLRLYPAYIFNEATLSAHYIVDAVVFSFLYYSIQIEELQLHKFDSRRCPHSSV